MVGSTGSGKTTFGRELARRLGVTFVELDALAWGPNWKLVPEELFKERVARAVEGESWVIDGNYAGRGARDLVWPRADTVVWLDVPLSGIFVRLFRRALRRSRSGEELWPGTGNRETLCGPELLALSEIARLLAVVRPRSFRPTWRRQ